MTDHKTGPLAYEPNLTRTRPLWLAGAGLAVLVVISLCLMWWLASGLTAGRGRPGPLDRSERDDLPVPRAALNPDQPAQRRQYEARQQEQLNSYGWVDQEQGLVHIPIENAMQMIPQKYGESQ